MKKLEKYKIAPQAKLVKFKAKHFVEIPTIRHDKAVTPLPDCLKSSSPLNVSPPWLSKFSSCPPAWLITQKSFPPWSQGGRTLWKGTYLSAIIAPKKAQKYAHGGYMNIWSFKRYTSLCKFDETVYPNMGVPPLSIILGTVLTTTSSICTLLKKTFFSLKSSD